MASLASAAVFDAAPSGPVPPLYVALGPEEVRDRSDKTARGALHRFAITVVGEEGGFHAVKRLAAAVEDALTGAPLSLSEGRVASLDFERARARRDRNGKRRLVELTFRARTDET